MRGIVYDLWLITVHRNLCYIEIDVWYEATFTSYH